MVASRLVDVSEKFAELAQLLAGRLALHLQALVVLPQVGHLCQQHHFVLLLLMEDGKERGEMLSSVW